MEPNQATQMQPAAPVPTPVTAWPGAFGIYEKSKNAIKFNLKTNLAVFALLAVTSIISNIDTEDKSAGLALVALIAGVFSLIFGVALIASTNASARAEKVSVSQVMKKGFSFLTVKYFALSILTVLMLVVSIIALIVPFFFVLPRVLLAPYFLVDKDLGPIEALKASWNQSKGHSSKVWGVIGVSLLMALAILILVGVYFLLMYAAAYSLLYFYVTNQQSTEVTLDQNAQQTYSQPQPVAPQQQSSSVQQSQPGPVTYAQPNQPEVISASKPPLPPQ